jgi:outer membrane protein TolC
VWLDVRTAWLAIEDARRRLGLTTLAVQSAEQNLQLAKGLFDVGRSSSLELTDAQISLAQARADDVQAHADELAALARLERAIGVAQVGP